MPHCVQGPANGVNDHAAANVAFSEGGNYYYSTTPGGTRIIYDRATLINLRNSPMSRTPPKGMAVIPGVTIGAEHVVEPTKVVEDGAADAAASDTHEAAEDLFEMD